MKTLVTLHALIAGLWLALGLVLCLKIALLGNEEKALSKQRGADFSAKRELSHQLARSRSQLDYEASAPALESSIQQLNLPLQPPPVAER